MIVVTAADSVYFSRLLTLLKSMRKNSPDIKVLVYDIGLTPNDAIQIAELCDSITIPEKVNDKMLDPIISHQKATSDKVIGLYSWKPAIIKEAILKIEDNEPLLWMDAGMTVLKPLNPIFNHIDKTGCFFIGVCDMGYMTTKTVRDYFGLTDAELLEQGINAAIMGIKKTDSNINDFVIPMYEYAKNINLFIDDGTAQGGLNAGRHDQTLFSIQVNKLGLPFFKTGNDMTLIDSGKITIPYIKNEIDGYSVIYHSRGDGNYPY